MLPIQTAWQQAKHFNSVPVLDRRIDVRRAVTLLNTHRPIVHGLLTTR